MIVCGMPREKGNGTAADVVGFMAINIWLPKVKE
jgi:hypothetical protein